MYSLFLISTFAIFDHSLLSALIDRQNALATMKETSAEARRSIKMEAIRMLNLDNIDRSGYWQIAFIAGKGYSIDENNRIKKLKIPCKYEEVMSLYKLVGIDYLQFVNIDQKQGYFTIKIVDDARMPRDTLHELTHRFMQSNVTNVIKQMHLTEQCIVLMHKGKLNFTLHFSKEQQALIIKTLAFFQDGHVFQDLPYSIRASKAIQLLKFKGDNFFGDLAAPKKNNAFDKNMNEKPLEKAGDKRGLKEFGPIYRWNFKDGPQRAESLPLTLHGNAHIQNGRLILDGRNSWAQSSKIDSTIIEKSFEIVITLDDTNQKASVPFYITNGKGDEDGFLYSYEPKKKWNNFSPQLIRSKDVGGPSENSSPNELIHLVFTYADNGEVVFYRNGRPYGNRFHSNGAVTYNKGDSYFCFGGVVGYNKPARNFMKGSIYEVKVYDKVLDLQQVQALHDQVLKSRP